MNSDRLRQPTTIGFRFKIGSIVFMMRSSCKRCAFPKSRGWLRDVLNVVAVQLIFCLGQIRRSLVPSLELRAIPRVDHDTDDSDADDYY